ncbi:uncharacterized protein LOC116261354 [Nymphaea colorata]|uniref:uncharacterized protein LOC116261354 n=1 Tax=Nymphaea colorata TaxID=210225 RepID=UPI00129D4363|nr:uncharacterized protein LOC116261354 [Nymphaea colorata]
MASTSAKSFHIRSTSFPSKSHPNFARVQECLHLVKVWEACPSRKAQFVTRLGHLKDLYASVNAFLQLPLTQQALCGKESLVRELMDDFLGLMDACGMLKDSLLHMREQHQSLRSMLRRGDSGLEAGICAYQCSRKRMKKDMDKCLRLLRSVEKHASSSSDNLDVVDQVFKDVRAATISIFIHLSSIFSAKKATQSIFSRLLSSKNRDAEADEDGVSEIEKADITIFKLHDKPSKTVSQEDARDAQRQMEALDVSLMETEVELEDVLRCMIQAKVSLLNIVAGC